MAERETFGLARLPGQDEVPLPTPDPRGAPVRTGPKPKTPKFRPLTGIGPDQYDFNGKDD